MSHETTETNQCNERLDILADSVNTLLSSEAHAIRELREENLNLKNLMHAMQTRMDAMQTGMEAMQARVNIIETQVSTIATERTEVKAPSTETSTTLDLLGTLKDSKHDFSNYESFPADHLVIDQNL